MYVSGIRQPTSTSFCVYVKTYNVQCATFLSVRVNHLCCVGLILPHMVSWAYLVIFWPNEPGGSEFLYPGGSEFLYP